MLGREEFIEIIETLEKNKLRTALTGFAVAWGIFIFIVLLGMGNGVENAMNKQFSDDAVNKLEISGGNTSMEHNGLQKGRRISMQEEDGELLEDSFDISTGYSTVLFGWGSTVTYKDKTGRYRIEGQSPQEINISEGRGLNQIDLKERRKVVVLGETVVKELFGKDNSNIIGQYVALDKIPFKVVGIGKYIEPWFNNRVVLPITTAQGLYKAGAKYVDEITLTLDATLEQSKEVENDIRKILGRKHEFNKNDTRAIWIDNNMEDYARAKGVIMGLKIFVGIIGILTLISGITGISNIMLISIKERTKEIGIRKALGAKPKSIIQQIILESVLITAIAGYIGLILGTLVVETVNYFMKGSENMIFENPTVDLSTALIATLIMIVAGALAGWLPARRAARIKPIEALRYE